MANTYHQLYIQTVFAVKYREAIIGNPWKARLLSVVGNLINETGCKTIIVNGVEDLLHCFIGLKPSVTISDVMKNAKAKSSKWVNENHFLKHRFEWQEGFGSFSYSRSHIEAVYNYIQNQEKHHRQQSFKDEYISMLEKYDIDYDLKYIFTDLINS